MTKKDKESAGEKNNFEDNLEEKEQQKISFEVKYNKKERLRVIKQGILNYLSRVGQSQRGLIADKLTDLKIWENPYEVYTGGKSKQILVQPTPEEITYCLNYLKEKTLLTYDEKRKIWIMTSELGKKKKGPTLDDFLLD
ncbi:MAG TPA: hypothetical protein VMV49_07810 [Candidatus Deferrimicrobium sp.]|nr:hypothetical protein [Candidatus Deferrimicrobium sp.]